MRPLGGEGILLPDGLQEIGEYAFAHVLPFTERVNSIGLKSWRVNVMGMIEQLLQVNTRRKYQLDCIRSKLATYEHDYHCLKEAQPE